MKTPRGNLRNGWRALRVEKTGDDCRMQRGIIHQREAVGFRSFSFRPGIFAETVVSGQVTPHLNTST
jgi:hypothetical protein